MNEKKNAALYPTVGDGGGVMYVNITHGDTAAYGGIQTRYIIVLIAKCLSVLLRRPPRRRRHWIHVRLTVRFVLHVVIAAPPRVSPRGASATQHGGGGCRSRPDQWGGETSDRAYGSDTNSNREHLQRGKFL